jgi:3-deoxy-D-manno-octulosonic-acid transferase
MDLAFNTYRWLSTGTLFALLPAFWLYSRITGKHGEGLSQRLGRCDHLRPCQAGTPRLWLHAASVGEVNAATTILSALDAICPGVDVVLSTTTATGHALAKDRFHRRAQCVFAPVDTPGVVRRSLDSIRPDVLACVETELWPCLLVQARRMGVRTAVVNGRISERSAGRYHVFGSLMGTVMDHIDAFSMISAADAGRIERIGALTQKVTVNGNAKFDAIVRRMPDIRAEPMARLLGLDGDNAVLVAGSTRTGEEEPVLEAFVSLKKRYPGLVLVLAPRHIERAPDIVKRADAKTGTCQRWTEIAAGKNSRHAPVVVLDTLGELPAMYGIADVVFCGGSLVPKGGQNILEPASLGKPVLFGPHMGDFQVEKELLLRGGGGTEVGDAETLAAAVGTCLDDPSYAERMGKAAQQVVADNTGAAGRHAEVIASLLPRPSGPGER